MNLDIAPLFDLDLSLFKAVEGETDTEWKFAGIAADESRDAEGDEILKKQIDLSYASTRGYVNWNHGREPGDQIGYLTKAIIVDEKQLDALSKSFDAHIPRTASVYVEGRLYKHVPKAESVHQIMKSSPAGAGLGLSVEGGVQRDAKTGRLQKAVVRGVAITYVPAQPQTLLQLRKSIDTSAVDPLLTNEQAILSVLRQQPTWTYDIAAQVVDYAKQRKAKGA